MMSIADLQALFAKIEGGTAPVDLLKVGQAHAVSASNNGPAPKNKHHHHYNHHHHHHNHHPNQANNSHKYRLALDIEDCLDRFYGGYYSDWACGGQWNRCYQFVQLLANAFENANCEVIAFFDGTLHDRRRRYAADARERRQKTVHVLKHIRMIGTPPPKIWWLPPTGLRMTLRNALRANDVHVVQTLHDHTRELIDYAREHRLHGICGLHADYIVASPLHYYSSHDLRMSYKGTLETKEYLVAKLLAHLDVTRTQLPFVAAFLGGAGAVAVETDVMRSVYAAIGVEMTAVDFEQRLKAVAKVVKSVPVDVLKDAAEFCKHLKLDEWLAPMRDVIEYYQRRERGLVKPAATANNKQQQQQQQQQKESQQQKKKNKAKAKQAKHNNGSETASQPNNIDLTTSEESATVAAAPAIAKSPVADVATTPPDDDASPPPSMSEVALLASETSDHDDEFQRKLESDVNQLVEFGTERDYAEMFDDMSLKTAAELEREQQAHDTEQQVKTDASEAAAAAKSADTSDEQTATKPVSTSAAAAAGETSKPAAGTSSKKSKKADRDFVYTLPSEVIKLAYNRHQRGMMDPRVYQLLTKKEIVLAQALEDEQYRDVPSVHLFYRPARQAIYAILFNLNHQKYIHSKQPAAKTNSTAASETAAAAPKPLISVNEWLWSPQNEYKSPEPVHALQLGWSVPTVQRLWFGTMVEDRQKRMKAFLSVMRSDTPLIMNRDYVPLHMLAMATVLRYIVTHPERTILSRQELDAFLVTAFLPDIGNIEYTQEMVLPCVFLRGVYLGTLFMQGIETASLANDTCGVPLQWTMVNPWLFFDGKLFHMKLKQVTCVQNLRELCDDHIDVMLKVERFRKAILEDVEHFMLPSIGNPPNQSKQQFFNANLQSMANNPYFGVSAQQQQLAGNNSYDRRRTAQAQLARKLWQQQQQQQQQHQQQQQRNGSDEYRLKVGGVVVGSWAGERGNKFGNNGYGPAFQHPNSYHHQQPLHPAMMSRPNYYDNAGGYSHNQPHPAHLHSQRMRGLNNAVLYNNMANRRRGGGGGGSTMGGGGVQRTIVRKNSAAGLQAAAAANAGGVVGGGPGGLADAKALRNKQRKQRTKNQKAAAKAAAASATATATAATTGGTAAVEAATSDGATTATAEPSAQDTSA